MHFTKNRQRQIGFIPDIYRILGKYTLIYVLETLIECGMFLKKHAWKMLACQKLIDFNKQQQLVKAEKV